MSTTKLINGERIPLTPEEQAERDAAFAEWEAGATERAAAEVRKTWKTVADFYTEFTDGEQYALQTSIIPDLIVARGKLAMWRGEVWSDDPDIIEGLNQLSSALIISEERKAEILAK